MRIFVLESDSDKACAIVSNLWAVTPKPSRVLNLSNSSAIRQDNCSYCLGMELFSLWPS